MNFSKGFLSVVIVIVGIGIISLLTGIFYFSRNTGLRSPESSPSSTQGQTMPSNAPSNQTVKSVFEEKELGIAFNYPSSWGNAVINVSASPTNLKKEITFSRQENIKIDVDSAATVKEIYTAQGYYPPVDLSQFCKVNITGDREGPLSENQDIFRTNGEDKSGHCRSEGKNTDTVVYVVKKTSDIGTPLGWQTFPNREQLFKGSGLATIKVQKTYYLKLKNPLYNLLSVTVTLPSQKSDKFCLTFVNYDGAKPWGDTPYGKNYSCLSHQDKEIIDNGFKNFDVSELNQEAEAWINDIKVNPIINPELVFANNFSETTAYENSTFRFRFNYPKIFQPQLKFERNRILIADFDLLQITSRDDMIKQEEDAKKCEGECFGATVTLAAWDNEKFLLASNPADGPVKCADGLLGNSLCEIKSFGGKKFLIRYTGRFSGESGIDKSYIIYNNGLRFELDSQPLYGVGTDPSKYKATETALIQNIIDNITKSLNFF